MGGHLLRTWAQASAPASQDGSLNIILNEDALARLKRRAPKYRGLSCRVNLTVPDAIYRMLPESARKDGSALVQLKKKQAKKVEVVLAGVQHTVRAEEHLMDIYAKLDAMDRASLFLSQEAKSYLEATFAKAQAHLHAAPLLQAHQSREVTDTYRRGLLQALKMDSITTPKTLHKLCFVVRDRCTDVFDDDEWESVIARRAKLQKSVAKVQKTEQDTRKGTGSGGGGKLKKFRQRGAGGRDARAAGAGRKGTKSSTGGSK